MLPFFQAFFALKAQFEEYFVEPENVKITFEFKTVRDKEVFKLYLRNNLDLMLLQQVTRMDDAGTVAGIPFEFTVKK